ncbi:MAG: alanine racemase [Kiritimatiellae bacterium]|nr:alanine racemase [Kiritimatiellia bacterium]
MKASWVELNLPILRANLNAARAALSSSSELIAVVKSNAYGHGMLEVAACAWETGVRRFAVAQLGSALRLRRAWPQAQIMILTVADPEDVPALVEQRIVPLIVSERQGEALAREARARGLLLACHAKIDTGMGRLGFAWDTAAPAIARLSRAGGLTFEGVCTHFASAGGPNRAFAQTQADRFRQCLAAAAEAGVRFPFVHMANSGGFLSDPAWDCNGVRLGILMYGYGNAAQGRVRTRPFLQWKASVVQVKCVPKGFPVSYDSTYVTEAPTKIATVNAGYGDGYPRLLSHKGFVLIGGRRCPIAGRVTMNLITVDVGAGSAVEEGAEVVLLGEQGDESIWADELARLCDTISYEIVTGINPALERRTVDSPAA